MDILQKMPGLEKSPYDQGPNPARQTLQLNTSAHLLQPGDRFRRPRITRSSGIQVQFQDSGALSQPPTSAESAAQRAKPPSRLASRSIGGKVQLPHAT